MLPRIIFVQFACKQNRYLKQALVHFLITYTVLVLEINTFIPARTYLID